jgi:hypothetical protein
MFTSTRVAEASEMSWKNSSEEISRRSVAPPYRFMPARARAAVPLAKGEDEAVAVVEALVQEGAADREWEVDPVLVGAGVRELAWEV